MPTYAILGATGATGSSILRRLLSQPPKDLTLKVFVRSKSKLLAMFPDLENTSVFVVHVIEGTPEDTIAMQKCLQDVDIIMGCIGSNIPTPGMTLIYDTATAITDALKINQKSRGPAYRPPTILQLRTCSLNPVFHAQTPWIAQKVLHYLLYYVYHDLDKACKLFVASAEESPGLLNYIFIDPPSIHDADGTTPTGYKLILDEEQRQELSYADLGVAFCEVATRTNEFAGKAVGVTATGKINLTWGVLMRYMALGAKANLWG